MKTCTECLASLPQIEFYRQAGGLKPACKKCTKTRVEKYRLAHLTEVAARRAKWYRAHFVENRARERKYRESLVGFISKGWASLNSRTINGSHPKWNQKRAASYLKKGVRLEITRVEFAKWCAANWDIILNIRANGGIASIDRIDPSKHYSLDNIRILPLDENLKLGSLLSIEIAKEKRTNAQSS